MLILHIHSRKAYAKAMPLAPYYTDKKPHKSTLPFLSSLLPTPTDFPKMPPPLISHTTFY